jgi:hypothetical protein
MNPGTAGTYNWYGFHTSARDLDGDGIENSLDTCPYTANVDGDPRTTAGPDADMIDSACDPTPGVDTNAGDHDLDGFKNAADNCPLVANLSQEEAERDEPTNIASPRGGSTTDAIGDACDLPEADQCVNVADDDIDSVVNDGCPAVGAAEPQAQCDDVVDDDGDTVLNDGCPGGPPERGAQCANSVDDDGDVWQNDGCPASGPPETGGQCSGPIDDDGDTLVNDGCPWKGTGEVASPCTNSTDDDFDGLLNDGCPTVGIAAAEPPGGAAWQCGYGSASEADQDSDGWPNDGCPQGGAAPEAGGDCEDFANDDAGDDALVNDGCPVQGGPEYGCLNTANDDGDGAINDGCPSSSRVANGHYHTVLTHTARCIGGTDVDGDGYCIGNTPAGCSPNGMATLCRVPSDPNDGNAGIIPETFSQLRPFTVAHAGSGANPPVSREPVQICSDGADNDGDGQVDENDDASISSPNVIDDCRPPDTLFAGATPDTDGDGSKDVVEIHLGTDPLQRCSEGVTPFATVPSRGWPMDLRGESGFSADKANVSDLGTFTAPVRRISTAPGSPGFDRRWDLRPGNNAGAPWIGIADMSVISSQVPPPMYGVRAFNIASTCSAHKVFGD